MIQDNKQKIGLFKLRNNAVKKDDRCLSYENPDSSKWRLLKYFTLNELSHEQISIIQSKGNYIYSSER